MGLGKEGYIRCEPSVQKKNQYMGLMCPVSSGNEHYKFGIFSAKPSILRFFY